MSVEVNLQQFYCNTTDAYFGPRFESDEEGHHFHRFLARDPRTYSADALNILLKEMRDHNLTSYMHESKYYSTFRVIFDQVDRAKEANHECDFLRPIQDAFFRQQRFGPKGPMDPASWFAKDGARYQLVEKLASTTIPSMPLKSSQLRERALKLHQLLNQLINEAQKIRDATDYYMDHYRKRGFM